MRVDSYICFSLVGRTRGGLATGGRWEHGTCAALVFSVCAYILGCSYPMCISQDLGGI
jgi:hypothetical protein